MRRRCANEWSWARSWGTREAGVGSWEFIVGVEAEAEMHLLKAD